MAMRRDQFAGGAAAGVDDGDRKIVKLRQGMINGVREKLPNGKGHYHYFKGIPYAQPPIGPLRFEPPVPLEKFPAVVLDCSKERSSCLGINILTRVISGTEDGLYLNVYTPGLAVKSEVESQPKLPVMVFIHGGGMIGGNGDSLLYNPKYLVQAGVVVVTMNYRLGVLGLLCLPEAGIEGNGALKDQRLALRWVHENISAFGGDPSNVTLFGASSAGACVGLHCTSESSRKYFHKAILQSGHLLCEFPYGDQMVQKARDLAKLVGYTGNSDKEVLEVLKNTPAWRLVEQQFQVLTPREKELEVLYQLPFGHVIERKESADPILTRNPLEFCKTPGSFGMPMIIGFNTAEGSMEVQNVLQHLNDYNFHYEKYIPRNLKVDYFKPEAKKVGEEIKRIFLGDQPVTKDRLQEILQFSSDRYTYTLYVFTYLWSVFQHSSNLFCYRFGFDGSLGNGKVKLPTIKGAAHMDEIFHLFSSMTVAEVTETDKAYHMRDIMVRLWTNFAKLSDPTPTAADDNQLSFQWNPIAKSDPCEASDFNPKYLNIEDTIRMVSLPERREFEQWARLHDKYNGHFTNLAFTIDDFQRAQRL